MIKKKNKVKARKPIARKTVVPVRPDTKKYVAGAVVGALEGNTDQIPVPAIEVMDELISRTYTPPPWDSFGTKVTESGTGMIIAECPTREVHGNAAPKKIALGNARLIGYVPELLDVVKELMEGSRLFYSRMPESQLVANGQIDDKEWSVAWDKATNLINQIENRKP